MLLNIIQSSPLNKELSSQNANSAEIEEPCVRRREEGWGVGGKKQCLQWMKLRVQHLLVSLAGCPLQRP